MRSCFWVFLLLFGLQATVDAAEDLPTGRPPIERFTPDIPVFPQNYTIAQDASGVVYLGNADGVLEFDGERWGLFRMPNGEIVRSLAVDAQGRVFVGGFNAFGYLQRDAAGRLHYIDLAARFATELRGQVFNDVWETFVMPEGVYFRCLRDVFFWSPKDGRRAHWRHAGRFGTMVHHDGRTLLQFRGEGLKWRDGDRWRSLPHTAALDKLVIALLPRPDGSLLAMGERWWRIRDDTMSPAELPASIPPPDIIQNTMVLDDGSAVLASVDGAAFVLSPDDRSIRRFKVDSGFLSGVHADRGGGFLVSSDDAFYRIAWPSEWTVLGEEQGLAGSLHGIASYDGQQFLLGSGGLLRLTTGSDDEPRALFDPRHREEAYDLLDLGEGKALLAGGHQLLLLDAQGARAVDEELLYPRLLQRSRFRPGRIFVGTEYGVRLLDFVDGRWKLRGRVGAETPARVTGLVEVSAEELWVGSDRGGLQRCRFDAAGEMHACVRVGAADGIRYGPLGSASVYSDPSGRLLAATADGLFVRQGAGFVRDGYGGLAGMLEGGEPPQLWRSPAGEEWARTSVRLFRRDKDGGWRELDIVRLRRGALESFAAEKDGRINLIATLGVLQFDPRAAEADDVASPQLLLRSVTRVLNDGRRESLPLHNRPPPHFPQGDYAVEFRFALPDFTRADGRRYQGRLLGYESEFSDWAPNSGYTYSFLPPGRFRAQIRALDARGRVSSAPDFEFVVDPPWYATGAAQLLFGLAGIGLLWLAVVAYVRRRTARLAAERNALESMVVARTADLADVNRRLETMANIDGLTGIANRRRLDDYLAAVWAQCCERSRALAVLAVDVDHFKQYNDRHGHLAGDELLKSLAQLLSKCLRRGEDLVARYGGEEFLVVMPGASIEVAQAAAEAMRRAVEESPLEATISIGVSAVVASHALDLKQLLERADAALYGAKDAGRNHVVSDGAD